jgi:hypothetical protein
VRYFCRLILPLIELLRHYFRAIWFDLYMFCQFLSVAACSLPHTWREAAPMTISQLYDIIYAWLRERLFADFPIFCLADNTQEGHLVSQSSCYRFSLYWIVILDFHISLFLIL